MAVSRPERILSSPAIQAAGDELFRQTIDRWRESTDDVHPVRVAIKRLRAWWRLLTDRDDPAAVRFDRRLRDVNRTLSPLRNARVLADTWQHQVAEASEKLAPAWTAIGPEMTAWIASIKEPPPLSADSLISTWNDLHAEWSRHPVDEDCVTGLVQRLGDTYRRCRRDGKRLTPDSAAMAVHEFRKRAKRWQYQLECVPAIEHKRWRNKIDRLKQLTDLLGRHHDLAALADGVREQVVESPERHAILKSLQSQQAAVLRKALRLSRRVFDDSPREMRRRIER